MVIQRTGVAALLVAVASATACTAQGRHRARDVPDVPPPPIYDPVPAEAPGHQPAWLVADSMIVDDAPGTSFTRNVIILQFRPEATPTQRAAAVRALGGTVVGGLVSPWGHAPDRRERGYIVWVPRGHTLDQLRAVIQRVHELPGLAMAAPHLLIASPGGARKP